MIPSNAPRIPKWAEHLGTALMFTVFTIIDVLCGDTSKALLVFLAYIVYSLIMAVYHLVKEHKSKRE